MCARVIVVCGATATGKTATAIALAKRFGGEIISADSMQIYRGMDIGTAKPTLAEREGIPHHLLDICAPDEDYSVANYQKDAFAAIDKIIAQGRLPIVAGGTGLYINALTYDLDFTRTKADCELRERLSREYDELGADTLHLRLAAQDALSATRIHKNDKKRLIRRLEILASGETKNYNFLAESERYSFSMIGLRMSRELLYAATDARVDNMLKNGLEEETRALYTRFGGDAIALQGIGYKEFIAYFRGEATREEAIELIKRNTRRLAKRQETWFKRDNRIIWFDLSEYDCSSQLMCDIIKQVGL